MELSSKYIIIAVLLLNTDTFLLIHMIVSLLNPKIKTKAISMFTSKINSGFHLNNITVPYCFRIEVIRISYITDITSPLQITWLHVPEYVKYGSSIFLSCVWKLNSTEHLYSLKWYKDGKEFYRYVPRDTQPYKTFLLPGVNVEEFDTTGSNISLSAATLEAEGRYRCEVSGERPNFLTVSRFSNLVVIVLPDHSPKLTYIQPLYIIGDKLEVNCTSGRSRPETTLSWYMNNVPEQFSLPPKYIEDKDGLKTTVKTLDFVISSRFFSMGRLTLKCLATIPNLYWESTEVSTKITRSTRLNKVHKNSFLENYNHIDNLTNSTISNYCSINHWLITLLTFFITFYL